MFGRHVYGIGLQNQIERTSEESDVEVNDSVNNGIKQFHPPDGGLICIPFNMIFFEVGGKLMAKLFSFEILQFISDEFHHVWGKHATSSNA